MFKLSVVLFLWSFLLIFLGAFISAPTRKHQRNPQVIDEGNRLMNQALVWFFLAVAISLIALAGKALGLPVP